MLDTNIWLDGLVFNDTRVAPLFEGLQEERWIAISNAACEQEWARVLRYSALDLEPELRAELAVAYAALTTVWQDAAPAPADLPRCRDRDDQKFVELAYASSAVALLSRDAELLQLSRRCERVFGCVVQTPEAWLQAQAASAA